MTLYPILFFADRITPCIGGMEMHAGYFIEYFINHKQFPLIGLVTKDDKEQDYVIIKNKKQLIDIPDLPLIFKPSIIFFNSGRWIEQLEQLRDIFPKAHFIYRTGGNEIIKASLTLQNIRVHSKRQSYWISTLNNTLDYIITNSAYTEKRLRSLDIQVPFFRCVGGVNMNELSLERHSRHEELTIFCAARFVPYKNHSLLLAVISKLVSKGIKLKLRLAGDGPLLSQLQEEANKNNLTNFIDFLGRLDNREVCREIVNADIYMQFSRDYATKVLGGKYIHSECMGRSILEALSAGTFVIAGQSGALEEIINSERGLLVDLSNIEEIIKKIMPIISNPPKKLPLISDYGWSTIFKSYEKLFKETNESTYSYRKM